MTNEKTLWNLHLTSDTFIIYAISHYTNGSSSWSEFNSDMKIFSRLTKTISYQSNDMQKTYRTALNNIICLSNVFPGISLARLLFFIADKSVHSEIKTFLHYIHRLPTHIPEVCLSEIGYSDSIKRFLKCI